MKRNLTAITLGLVLIMGLAGSAVAGSGAGAISMTFPVGARYNALGEAGVALSQDVTAIWWNPGGLAFLPQGEKEHGAHIMQSSLAQGLADDIGLYWGGYAMPLGGGTIGFAINFLDMGDQEGMDENGERTEVFHSYMYSLHATYGVQLSSTLGVGIGVSFFQDKLAPKSAIQDVGGTGSGHSFGVDMGIHWKTPFRSNIGLSVVNCGKDITHIDADQADPMPRKATIGLVYDIWHSDFMAFLLAADYQVPLYQWQGDSYGIGMDFDYNEYGGGLEWNYLKSLYVRFGWKSAKYGDIDDSTYGFGVDMTEWSGQAISVDFCSVPQASTLDRVSRVSLGYRF